MKKALALALSTAVLFGILAGCDSSGGGGGAGGGKVYLNFPTASTSGTVYSIGASMANLWNENIENLQVSAEASNGGVQNLNLMSQGDAQMGVAVTSIVMQQRDGQDVFADHQYEGARVLCAMYSNFNQVVVTDKSGINTLEDIAGKRFAPGATGGTAEVETRSHLVTLGIDYPNAISAQFVGFTEAVDLMRNQQLDGAWIQGGLPVSAVSEMCSTANGRVIPMSEELVDKMVELYPWYNKDYIPAGTYDGQDTDILTTSLPITLVVDESVDEEIVYQMTKVLWENIDSLKATASALKDATPETAVEGIGDLQLHPGAERYYREVGAIK